MSKKVIEDVVSNADIIHKETLIAEIKINPNIIDVKDVYIRYPNFYVRDTDYGLHIVGDKKKE